jgi:hypothetical protein
MAKQPKKKRNPIAKITDSRDLYAIAEKKIARKRGIHINPANKGKFTAKAKAAGKSVAGYAKSVLKKNSKASAATKKQAVFAQNAKKWKH